MWPWLQTSEIINFSSLSPSMLRSLRARLRRSSSSSPGEAATMPQAIPSMDTTTAVAQKGSTRPSCSANTSPPLRSSLDSGIDMSSTCNPYHPDSLRKKWEQSTRNRESLLSQEVTTTPSPGRFSFEMIMNDGNASRDDDLNSSEDLAGAGIEVPF